MNDATLPQFVKAIEDATQLGSDRPDNLTSGLFAVSDSLDRIASALQNNQKPSTDPPLRVTVASVLPATGWRVLIGEIIGGDFVFSHLPMLSWVTKVNHAIGGDDILQVPMVWDGERGVELDVYLEEHRLTSPGISSRLLGPGQDALTGVETKEFEEEIRQTFRYERRAINEEILAVNKRIVRTQSHRPEPIQQEEQV